MEIRDIEKLAKLSRLELTDSEKATFARELESILKYVDQIREVSTGDQPAEIGDIYNVLREDIAIDGSGVAHESGMFTEKILAQAPDTQDSFIKVKKIL